MLLLDNNENLFGASELALAAARSALSTASFYPHSSTAVLAQFLGVQETQIILGNGSENILELIVKVFLQPGDDAIISQYAFVTIPRILSNYRVHIQTVPARNYAHDLSALLGAIESHTRAIFIVNPNNPTGTYIPERDLYNFLLQVPDHVLVILDEAYREYLQNDPPESATWIRRFPNLIVVRTFSKAYGLAGLRLGYGIAVEHVTAQLNCARLPFNVNRVALAAAEAALGDQEHIQTVLARTRQGMTQIEQGLAALPVSYIPSQGNFLMLDVARPAEIVFQRLLGQGVKVRLLQDYQLPTHLRVTIGNAGQNECFLKTLAKSLEAENSKL